MAYINKSGYHYNFPGLSKFWIFISLILLAGIIAPIVYKYLNLPNTNDEKIKTLKVIGYGLAVAAFLCEIGAAISIYYGSVGLSLLFIALYAVMLGILYGYVFKSF